jgi:NitT/TauT family transport system ATP-binding protein
VRVSIESLTVVRLWIFDGRHSDILLIQNPKFKIFLVAARLIYFKNTVTFLLSLNHIDCYYGSTAILQDIHLQVRAGEFVAIVGASGCGKSTLLKLVAGLLAPHRGTLIWQESLQLSFVFQEPALMPWARTIDNVALPLKLVGVPQARTRAQRALELVGLSDWDRAYPHQLSGGMKMRVSIARALVTQPQVMLMDEPFGALDDLTRHKLNNELTALSTAQAWTTIFVTHNIGEAVYLADRVLIMAAQPGRIMGEVKIPVAQPRTDFRYSTEHNEYCRLVSEQLFQCDQPVGRQHDA